MSTNPTTSQGSELGDEGASAPALAPSCPLIEGYGDELENDYQSGQIFGNHCPPKPLAQPCRANRQSCGLEAQVVRRQQKFLITLGPWRSSNECKKQGQQSRRQEEKSHADPTP